MTDSIVKDKLSTAEKPTTTLPDKWDYQTFKDYLLAMSRGKEFRLPMDQMPAEIQLSPEWHETLDTMRDGTAQDGRERWTGIGYKDDKSGLWLRNKPLVSATGSVTSNALQFGSIMEQISGKQTGRIGDIHSHPRIKTIRPLDRLVDSGPGHFSLGDFYTLVHRGSNDSIMGVVDGDDNVFAVRTAQSINTAAKSQKQFQETWMRKNNWEFLGCEDDKGEMGKPGKGAPNYDKLNKLASKEYGLTLYLGKKDKPLRRIYPEIPKPPTKNPFIPAK